MRRTFQEKAQTILAEIVVFAGLIAVAVGCIGLLRIGFETIMIGISTIGDGAKALASIFGR